MIFKKLWHGLDTFRGWMTIDFQKNIKMEFERGGKRYNNNNDNDDYFLILHYLKGRF